jgi:hypothetical protein
MEVRDYYNRGKEYFDSKDFDRAVKEFMKALEITMGPDEDGVMQEKLKEYGPQATAIFLLGLLEQNL